MDGCALRRGRWCAGTVQRVASAGAAPLYYFPSVMFRQH